MDISITRTSFVGYVNHCQVGGGLVKIKTTTLDTWMKVPNFKPALVIPKKNSFAFPWSLERSGSHYSLKDHIRYSGARGTNSLSIRRRFFLICLDLLVCPKISWTSTEHEKTNFHYTPLLPPPLCLQSVNVPRAFMLVCALDDVLRTLRKTKKWKSVNS